MKGHFIKRWSSFILVLSLVFSIFPNGFAYAEENTLVMVVSNYDENNGYYRIEFQNEHQATSITKISVGDRTLNKSDTKNSFLFPENSYYIEQVGSTESTVYIKTSLEKGNEVTFTNSSGDYTFRVLNKAGYTGIFDTTPVIKSPKEPSKDELNKDELMTLIVQAKKIEKGNKTETAFNTLKDAITTAEHVNETATQQQEIDAAKTNLDVAIEEFNTSEDEQSDRITLTDGEEGDFFKSYYLVLTPNNKTGDVKELSVNNKPLTSRSSKVAVNPGDFCVDTASNKIYIGKLPQIGEIVILKDAESEVIGTFEKTGQNTYAIKSNDVPTEKNLYAQLRGQFEAAVTGQRDYDAISSATSGGATANENSKAFLYVVETENGRVPEESEYKLFKDSNLNLTVVPKIVPNDSGMEVKWNPIEGRVTLKGTPNKAGTYKVSAEINDVNGNSIITNELDFEVYDWQKIKLSDVLKEENFTNLKNGNKKQWDMKPWYIELFDNEDKGSESSVTVPKSLKLWWGSHESGTYGSLGYPISQEQKPHQTLIVPDGAELYLCNMKILSSVKIVVQNGGKLNLHDSSLYGQVVVQSGGKFQMNYDDFKNEFLTGSSVQGQIILEDGSILEDSLIYSNGNSLTDGKIAKKIEGAVVEANGNVTVNGTVYVRGDEAPTGTSSITHEAYQGQPAMELEDGAKLNITENSVLGLYGGGKKPLTTNGGTALKLGRDSEVTGQGKLIAVGGDGQMGGKGGTAIMGNGKVSVKEAYLQGGNVYNKNHPAGKAYEDTVVLSGETVGYAKDGKANPSYEDEQNSPYWVGTKGPEETVLNNSSTVGAKKIIQEHSEKFKNHQKDKVEKIEKKQKDKVEKIEKKQNKEKLISNEAYMIGYPDGTIRPDGKATRAEAATMVAKLQRIDLDQDGRADYLDVKSGWYNKYLNAMVEKGMLLAEQGKLRLNQPITRAEFLRLISVIDEDKEVQTLPFNDVKGHKFESEINKGYANGRIVGYPDGSFRPEKAITRAEMVIILNNLYNRKVDIKKIEELKNKKQLKTFTDLNEKHWAYYELLEATGYCY